MRNGYVDGNDGAFSMAETTCVIPRSANWDTSSAVARQVRYRRGAILLATRLFVNAERFGLISGCCGGDGGSVDVIRKGSYLETLKGCKDFILVLGNVVGTGNRGDGDKAVRTGI